MRIWFVGLDVHRDATAICVIKPRGVFIKRVGVATTRTALRHALKGIRGRVRIVGESGPLASWIRDSLETRLREVVVCDRRRSRLATSGAKTDRIDADKLSDLLRANRIHTVFVPRDDHALLRRMASHYIKMLRDR